MNFRSAAPSDAQALAGLIHFFQPILTLDPAGTGAEDFMASVSESAEREYIQSPRYDYIIAEEGNEIAGFIAIRDACHLFHLFVAPGFQRKGLARALWNQAHARTLVAGGTTEITVNASLNAVPVYERLGFVQVEEKVEKHGIAFIPMRRREGQGDA